LSNLDTLRLNYLYICVVGLQNEEAESIRLRINDLIIPLIEMSAIIGASEIKLSVVVLLAVDCHIPETGIAHLHFILDIVCKGGIVIVEHDTCLCDDSSNFSFLCFRKISVMLFHLKRLAAERIENGHKYCSNCDC
jgi:hypothetical protein